MRSHLRLPKYYYSICGLTSSHPEFHLYINLLQPVRTAARPMSSLSPLCPRQAFPPERSELSKPSLPSLITVAHHSQRG